MINHVRPGVKVKAAGGISTLEDAAKFLQLGAARLGSSRLVKLVNPYTEKLPENYSGSFGEP